MKWNTRRQSARDNNVNIQAEGDIHLGIGYGDVKEIAEHAAMSVFEQNFQKLSLQAYAVAQERAAEFTRNFIEALQERAPHALRQIQDPGTQSAVFAAQSGYAKTGDPDLGEVLLELLIERTSCDRRETSQLASNFALTVAENLSPQHFSLLSCSLILKQIVHSDGRSVDSLARSIWNVLGRFSDDLAMVYPADLDYLSGLGCMISTAGSLSPGRYVALNYPGLFTRGFSLGEIAHAERLIGTPLVRPFGPDPDRYKINAITKPDLKGLIDAHCLHDMNDIAFSALSNTTLEANEIERILANSVPELTPVFRECGQLGLNGYINTAIGSAIAHANIRRVIPEFDLPFASLVSKRSPF